jgi:hypothetical protein
MITLTQTRTENGYPLTESGLEFQEPWSDSPQSRAAAEQAPVITVTKVAGTGIQLQWSPDSGQTARSDVWLTIDVSDSATPVAYLQIDWKDGGAVQTVQCYGVRDFSRTIMHTYTADPSADISVTTYDGNDGSIESQTLALSFTRNSYYRIGQYRVERFKGKLSYNEYDARWYPDWTEFTGDSDEMDYYDYDANLNWNWGYRLWLREVDEQDRPDLVMVPSEWAEVGEGEGA